MILFKVYLVPLQTYIMELFEKTVKMTFSRSLPSQKNPSQLFSSVLSKPLKQVINMWIHLSYCLLVIVFLSVTFTNVALKNGFSKRFQKNFRSSYRRCSVREGVLKISQNSQGNTLCQGLIFKNSNINSFLVKLVKLLVLYL